MARKLEEAVLVWLVERSIDKERILELYLNCIEFGPGIYGIRHAAEVYFGVRPQDLKPIEAAWIMSVKPNPYTWGYKPWRRRFVSESRKNDMVTRIRNRLIKYEWISEEDALAMDSDTVFERVAPVDAYEIPEGWFYDPRERDGAQNN
jgi:membrane peptidoglycan carboxypeptidase